VVDTVVLVFVRIGYELIGRRIDEINILHIHISTYCIVFILQYCCVFLMCLDIQGEISYLMVYCFYIYSFSCIIMA